ncbi:MAG: DUF1178 family protein [Hyphomicrobium sp.]
MIKYRLRCACSNEFEAWFQSSTACDAQVQGDQVACPRCGSHDVDKAIMAPNVLDLLVTQIQIDQKELFFQKDLLFF